MRPFALAAAVLLLIGESLAQSNPEPELPSRRILKLINDLESSAFETREKAASELTKLAIPAWPQLMDARRHATAEVRFQVDQILRQLRRRSLSDAFRDFADQTDDATNIEEGMWLISRILNPDSDGIALVTKLDGLAEKVRRKLDDAKSPKTISPDRIVSAIRDVLFVDEGFTGNDLDYSNPANSSLEDVLESRKGLPIVLSQITISVARRLEIPIVGVPTPGRFIVKYDGKSAPPGFASNDIYLDPFDHGKVLSREDRIKLFPGLDPDEEIPAGPQRDVLIRMLYNIETHLFERDNPKRARLAVEFRTALQSASK